MSSRLIPIIVDVIEPLGDLDVNARLALLALVLAAAPLAAQAPKLPAPKLPTYVADAVADPSRPAAHRANDARRHTAELVAFTEAQPGSHVVDLVPGYGQFTRVFSKLVGPKGRVYALWPEEYGRMAQGNVKELRALGAVPGYGNVSVIVQPAAKFAAPSPLDVVFASQIYHDYPNKFMGRLDPAQFNRAVFRALKPGGTFVVVDHAAQAGSGLRDTEALHRIDEAAVRRQVEAAGFEFVGSLDILRNPADKRTLSVFDKSIRGRTDQFALKFRKPRG